MSDQFFVCPVCGYPQLTRRPWQEASASHEICPSCGTHFGYDDAAGGDAGERLRIYAERRNDWKAAGCPWRSASAQIPERWDPVQQLRNVE